ncbi:hypothetical protein BpHYR1_023014 [Brachionus plicatilis]|uniref:Uncharacterized protein n=1 Tax=Brachionus plicatilis TaxID=10195 RepID=A0A3M7QE93_BRAPC|nr:hypothetical protein BpHYR1_023014 [Brachionus plicatilis]
MLAQWQARLGRLLAPELNVVQLFASLGLFHNKIGQDSLLFETTISMSFMAEIMDITLVWWLVTRGDGRPPLVDLLGFNFGILYLIWMSWSAWCLESVAISLNLSLKNSKSGLSCLKSINSVVVLDVGDFFQGIAHHLVEFGGVQIDGQFERNGDQILLAYFHLIEVDYDLWLVKKWLVVVQVVEQNWQAELDLCHSVAKVFKMSAQVQVEKAVVCARTARNVRAAQVFAV